MQSRGLSFAVLVTLAGTFTAPISIAAMAIAALVINSVIYRRRPELGELQS